MTAPRIFATDKPVSRFAPVKPMSREDEEFWKLLHKRQPHMKELSDG